MSSPFTQNNFVGGMNLLTEEVQLNQNEYALGRNLSCRYTSLRPQKLPRLLSSPAGTTNHQLLVALVDYLLLFSDGLAWYAQIPQNDHVPQDDLTWHPVISFSGLDPDVTKYYGEIVPASYENFQRKANDDFDNGKGVARLGSFNFVTGTPAALVVQDGINQPRLIYIDSVSGLPTSRRAYTYAEWSDTESGIREYVPIGKVMKYVDGVLYVSSPDGKSIYRSVTGRPLDFMVIVDEDGKKMAAEADGDAKACSFAVDYDPVTCIASLNNGKLFIATENNSYEVTPDYQNTIWGEPRYVIKKLFNFGCVNHQSFADILGDFAIISHDGLRSYNAVLSNQREARTNLFGLGISPLIKGKIQDTDTVCVGTFEDYILFNITSSSDIVILYDTTTQRMCSIMGTGITDSYKQFSSTLPYAKRLFAITTGGEIYEIFGSDEYATALVKLRAYAPSEVNQEQKTQTFHVAFGGHKQNGTVKVDCFVDGQRTPASITKTLSVIGGTTYPLYYPITYTSAQLTDVHTFNFVLGRVGWKVSYAITWDSGAPLLAVTSATDVKDIINNSKTAGRTYGT